MQIGFMADFGTTNFIFILGQLQEKYLNKQRNIYFGFVDLKQAFHRVPLAVMWWAIKKLGVGEWIIQVVKSLNENTQ